MIMFLNVNAQSKINNTESARLFVQKFYDWYGQVYAKQRHIIAHVMVLKHHPPYLDKELFDALVADDRAQEKYPRAIIGLGFDPFTNDLDARKGFQTGLVTQNGVDFFVDVHDIKNGRSKKEVLASEIILTAEVTKMNGHFAFVNFIYPKTNGYINGYMQDGSNLLGVLDSLHKDRIKQHWKY